jgi:cytochrome c oxidase subunit 2
VDELQLFPEAASSAARSVDALFFYVIGTSVVFALLIFTLVVVFAVRYRRRAGAPAPEQIHGSVALELAWTLVPLALVASFFWWGARVYFDGLRPPAGAMELSVTAKQWMWKVQHPTGQREINALHVPVGVPIRLELISEDVIHDFYVPAFRKKLDVLPGRYSSTWFEATRTGSYHLFCAEYCGTKHSEMIGTVHVLEQEDYALWLAGNAAGETPVEAGARLFVALRCDTCHSPSSGSRGPDLGGRYGQIAELEGGALAPFDAGYVRESLLEPRRKLARGYQPLMPTYAGQLDEEQILALIAFLESLPPGSSTGVERGR